MSRKSKDNIDFDDVCLFLDEVGKFPSLYTRTRSISWETWTVLKETLPENNYFKKLSVKKIKEHFSRYTRYLRRSIRLHGTPHKFKFYGHMLYLSSRLFDENGNYKKQKRSVLSKDKEDSQISEDEDDIIVISDDESESDEANSESASNDCAGNISNEADEQQEIMQSNDEEVLKSPDSMNKFMKLGLVFEEMGSLPNINNFLELLLNSSDPPGWINYLSYMHIK